MWRCYIRLFYTFHILWRYLYMFHICLDCVHNYLERFHSFDLRFIFVTSCHLARLSNCEGIASHVNLIEMVSFLFRPVCAHFLVSV